MLDEAYTPLPSTALVFAMSPRNGPLFTEQLFVSIFFMQTFLTGQLSHRQKRMISVLREVLNSILLIY